MAGELVKARAAASGRASSRSTASTRHSGSACAARTPIRLTAGADRQRRTLPAASARHVRTRSRPPKRLPIPPGTWGPKVTINSATMMNKGLEVIEAHFLSTRPTRRSMSRSIRPASSTAGSSSATARSSRQMGVPDMRVPIALALADGVAPPGCGPHLDLRDVSPLEFLPVDGARFPAVALARAAGERGGLATCIFNAANEEAVTAFTAGQCRFDEIVPLVGAALAAFDAAEMLLTLDDVLAADAWARELVRAAHGGSGRGSMTQFLIYAGAFILVLVSVITVHEFGHFSSASSPASRSRSSRRLRTQDLLDAPSARPLRGSRDSRRWVRAHGRHARARRRNVMRGSATSTARASPRRFATVAAGICANFIFGGLIFAIIDMQPTPYAVRLARRIRGSPACATGDVDPCAQRARHPSGQPHRRHQRPAQGDRGERRATRSRSPIGRLTARCTQRC